RDDPQIKYEIEIPPPSFFKGSRRLVMDPLNAPTDSSIVHSVARNHKRVTGQSPRAIGTVMPSSYTCGDVSWLSKQGISGLYYGPAGGFWDKGGDGSYII